MIPMAARSFTLPPGFRYSSLAKTSADPAGTIRFNCSMGVSPTNWVMSSVTRRRDISEFLRRTLQGKGSVRNRQLSAASRQWLNFQPLRRISPQFCGYRRHRRVFPSHLIQAPVHLCRSADLMVLHEGGGMHRQIVKVALFCLCVGQTALQAQEFKLFDRTIQFHGFASQGFIYTNDNNWLTMHTSQGSGAFTDFGANASMQVTDKFRIGAQVYDRNLGNLGEWHPSLDWAFADYRFNPWFGVRGGKVKTVLGLYNDTQDLDFLHTFALLPQSIYPTDLRDVTLAHLGGDIYGDIRLSDNLGTLSYTAYAGHRNDSIYDGYPLLLQSQGVYLKTQGGLQYGADLRWKTPLKGLLVGLSRINQDITATGLTVNQLDPAGPLEAFSSTSKAVWT